MKTTKFGHVQIPFRRIHIELTNVCDFNCTFCPKSVMERPYGYIDPELAKNIISEIGRLNLADKITFHVMGEPTLHPQFFRILDHAQTENVPVGLTTNGGGLGEPLGPRLLDYRLHQVDVSLQTPDERSFALRKAGRLDFDRYLDNIFNFFKQYRERYPETIFKFRFLNTIFPQKTIEAKMGPVRVISSTRELRSVFTKWVDRVYETVGVDADQLERAHRRINKLAAHKWYVIEILPNIFFETYILADWGHAFHNGPVHRAWAGFCDGMRDHFAILHNGDVTLCCIDFDGRTAIGNLNQMSLTEILSSDTLGNIMKGFKAFRPVHPYCQRCLGSKSRLAWLVKPPASIVGLHLLRPYFYRRIRLF